MNERLVNNSCEPRKEKKVRRSRESQVGDIWVFLFFFDYFVCVQKTLSHVHCIFTKRVSPTYHCLEFLFLSFLYFIYFFFFSCVRATSWSVRAIHIIGVPQHDAFLWSDAFVPHHSPRLVELNALKRPWSIACLFCSSQNELFPLFKGLLNPSPRTY